MITTRRAVRHATAWAFLLYAHSLTFLYLDLAARSQAQDAVLKARLDLHFDPPYQVTGVSDESCRSGAPSASIRKKEGPLLYEAALSASGKWISSPCRPCRRPALADERAPLSLASRPPRS